MFQPENEQGVVALFCMSINDSPWHLISIGASYPDAVVGRDGDEWRVEFEFVASNFVSHGHDPRKCDMIVCWENDYPGCPLPVIALSDSGSIHAVPEKCQDHLKEIEYWKQRALRSERKRKLEGAATKSGQPNSRMSAQDRRGIIMGEFETRDTIHLSELMDKLDVSINTVKGDIKSIDGAELTGDGYAKYVNGVVK